MKERSQELKSELQSPERKAYSIPQVCAAVGLSRGTIYGEIRDKRLHVCKVGRRTLVTSRALGDWLALCEAKAS